MQRIAALFIFLFVTPVFGFTLSSTNTGMKGFDTSTLGFYLNPTNCPSGIEDDIEEAMELWNSVNTSDIVLELAGTTSTTAASLRLLSFPETAVIACSTDFGTDSADSSGSNGCTSSACLASVVGVGLSTFDSSLHLQKGYLVLNLNSGVQGNYGGKSSTKRKITVAHEIGHVLGLGHSEESAALMHYSISEKDNLALHQDDMDGITYLYPLETIGGCGSIGPPPPPKFGFKLLFIALLFFPLMLALGIRRKSSITT